MTPPILTSALIIRGVVSFTLFLSYPRGNVAIPSGWQAEWNLEAIWAL
jgi:hypothetical protein